MSEGEDDDGWVRQDFERLRDEDASAEELWSLSDETNDPVLRADILELATEREVGFPKLWLEYIGALEKLGNTHDDIYAATLMMFVHCKDATEYQAEKALQACVRSAAPHQVAKALRNSFHRGTSAAREAVLPAALLANRPDIVLDLARKMESTEDAGVLEARDAYVALAAALTGDWERAQREWPGFTTGQIGDEIGVEAMASALLIALRRRVPMNGHLNSFFMWDFAPNQLDKLPVVEQLVNELIGAGGDELPPIVFRELQRIVLSAERPDTWFQWLDWPGSESVAQSDPGNDHSPFAGPSENGEIVGDVAAADENVDQDEESEVVHVTEVTTPPPKAKIRAGLRFEVLKRDKFQCQYCGAKAPDVLLHLDHIHPESKGGETIALNLVTACSKCNLGKGARLLSDDSVLAKQREQLHDLAERREQMAMLLDWRRELQSAEVEEAELLVRYWNDQTPGFVLNEHGTRELRSMVQRFGVERLVEAIAVAVRSLAFAELKVTEASYEVAFEMIRRVAYTMRSSETNPHLHTRNQIRKMARVRLSRIDEKQAAVLLDDALALGVDAEFLRELTMRNRTWDQWREAVEEAIQGA